MAEPERVGARYVRELQAAPAFGVLVGDEVVRLDELHPLALAAVQRRSGVPWTELLDTPTADLLGALALVEACEAHAGADAASAPLTVHELLPRFVRVAPSTLEAVPDAASEADAGAR